MITVRSRARLHPGLRATGSPQTGYSYTLIQKHVPNQAANLPTQETTASQPESIECERKFAVATSLLPLPLPQPWIFLQLYLTPKPSKRPSTTESPPMSETGEDVSLRLIPARRLAYLRRKNFSYSGCRQKIASEVSYERALEFLAKNPQTPIAFKFRHIVRDADSRAWLLDYFPLSDHFQTETEFSAEEVRDPHSLDQDPIWVTTELTHDPVGYTRNYARVYTTKHVENLLSYAEKYGSTAVYTPAEMKDTDSPFVWKYEKE